jgi:hypothetical protein
MKDMVEWDSLHISVSGPAPEEVRGGVEGYIALDNAIDDILAEIKHDVEAKLKERMKTNPELADFKFGFS